MPHTTNIFKKIFENDLHKEKIKIIFQYSLMLIASVIAGGAFTYLLENEFLLQVSYRMSVHFEIPFANCAGITEVIQTILQYSLPELIGILTLCVFSFSAITDFIADLILVYEGFHSGFSALLLYQMKAASVGYYPKTGHVGTFVLFKGIILVCFFLYAFRITLYSHDGRQWNETGRAVFSMRMLAMILIRTVAFSGLILLLNSLYGVLIFLL